MRKGLLISQYFPPDITAAAFRMGDLYKYLTNNGDQIDVITTTPHKAVVKNNIKDFEGSNITRIDLTNLTRVKQYYKFYRDGKRLVKNKDKYDYIIVSSPPMFVFSIAKAAKKDKLILDIRDIWPDSAVGTGTIKKGILYKYFKIKEKKMYKESDYITCVSKPMAKYIKEISGKEPEVIYNGFSEKDLSKYSNINSDESNEIRIGYFGNIGLAQNMEILPKALKKVFQSIKNEKRIKFEIIGTGSNLSKIKKIIEKNNLDKYFIINEPMLRDDLINYCAKNIDTLFINLVDDKIFEKTIPSKVFDYLLLEKPIISGIKGEGSEILEKTRSCIKFEPNSEESLAEAIIEMINHLEKYKKNAKNYSREIAKNYVRENMFEKLKKMI